MENKHMEREPYYFGITFISAGKTYNGYIEKISEDELDCLLTSFIDAPEGFTPDKNIMLNLPVTKEETIRLNCETIWFLREPEDKKTFLGIKIVNLPQKYRDLIKNHKTDNDSFLN